MDTTQFSGARRRLAGLALAAALLGAAAAPAAAAVSTGSIYAGGLNTPGGSVWMGTHLWATDHVSGLCRLDPADPALKLPAGSLAPNAATCVLPGVAGGQPSFDPATNFVYVPDNSTKGNAVYRLSFNALSETVQNPVALGVGAVVAGTKPTATVLGPDGNLYVGFIKSNQILRITSPAGAAPTAQYIGTSTDRLAKGTTGLAFANASDGSATTSLYLAEGGGISEIPNATACTAGCAATMTNIVVPTTVNGALVTWETLDVVAAPSRPNVLYVAKWAPHNFGPATTIVQYTIGAPSAVDYSTGYTAPDGKLQPWTTVTDLAPNPAGGLFVAHDPTNGGTNGALVSRLP